MLMLVIFLIGRQNWAELVPSSEKLGRAYGSKEYTKHIFAQTIRFICLRSILNGI